MTKVYPEQLNGTVKIDAMGLSTRELNVKLREMVAAGVQKIELRQVYGQRYIGTDLNQPVEIEIFGTPGNDLGSFMDGPRITVRGNAQDGLGNTMNNGDITVHGHAGDIIGLSARGGRIFIRDDVGYRAGIHMKAYGDKQPTLVIGGTAQDFAGEYMAGGIMVLLGLTMTGVDQHKTNYIGTGMHGGVIYLRGGVENYQLGKEVGTGEVDEEDCRVLAELVNQYATRFKLNAREILDHRFLKIYPVSHRPYGRLYAY